MILIELGPDDFDRHGFAIVGCVVSAIAKVIQSDSGLNRFQAERDAWPHILTGVKLGAIHPIDPGTRHSLSIDHCGDSVIRFKELVNWGKKTELYDFKKVDSHNVPINETTLEEKTDSAHCQAAYDETCLNGNAINWGYWAHQMPTLTAAQAAYLMSALEPDKFVNLNERPGRDDPTKNIDKARKIQRLAEQQGRVSAAPGEWVEWAKAQSMNVHTGFLLAVWEKPETATEQVRDAIIAETGICAIASVNPCGVCDVFRAMENLTADKVSIVFTGQKSETGLGNTMLTISANKVTRHVPVGNLDLVNRSNKSTLNRQGTILLGMAQKGGRLLRNDANSTAIKRLRKMFKVHLGITSDPFEPYNKTFGYVSLFKITDKLGAADERAKEEAERRTDSLEQMNERGEQIAGADQAGKSSSTEYPYHKEKSDKKNSNYNKDEKEGDDWLENNDPQA